MAPSRKRKRSEEILEILTLEDVMCPVCRSIIIEPVSLPCNKHVLCYFCFEKTIENNALTCPLCRKRIGSWLRSATKNHSLINVKLWKKIQEQFPEQVKSKQNGEEDGVEEQVINSLEVSKTLSTPGEIKKEFDELQKKFHDELSHEQQCEERASVEFIHKLLETEISDSLKRKTELQRILQTDESLAKTLQSELATLDKAPVPQSVTPTDNKRSKVTKMVRKSGGKIKEKNCSVTLENYFGTTPRSNSSSSRVSQLSRSSHNSFDTEFRHFKPIIKEPKTPPKKMSDGRVLDLKPRKIQPLNLESSGKFDDVSTTILNGPIVQLSSDGPKAFLKLNPSANQVYSSCKGSESSATVVSVTSDGAESGSDTDFEDETENNAVPMLTPNAGTSTSTLTQPQSSLTCDTSIHLYSVLEEEIRMRLRQEEEDLRFAKYLQDSWNEEAKKEATNFKSEYQLRSRPSRTTRPTNNPVRRQTTLDKHIQPVTL